MGRFAAHHDEVADALMEIGNLERGAAVQRDRRSGLQHLGIAVPALRARVREGFSFTTLPESELLEVWDELWRTSPYADVLFAALEHYLPVVRKQVPPGLWPVVRNWSGRVDNWCHSDLLSSLYSRILEARFDEVYPQLVVWNQSDSEWLRRMSMTSLIHYTGKHAVFLAPDQILPLVANCVDDHRKYVELAVGWVLREVDRVHTAEVTGFLSLYAGRMSSRALRRAAARRT
jgi:3-methyladenine DNA glycosylase AlkD